VSSSLIFTRYSTVPIAHIALAVVAVFVEVIDAGKLTSEDVLAIVGPICRVSPAFDELIEQRFKPN
jgi:hypothetical protein